MSPGYVRRPLLEVELAGVGSVVRGYGSRGLVIQITGHPPVWRPSRRGWSVQEKTAADVVAAAENAGYDIVITGPTGQRVGQFPPTSELLTAVNSSDPGAGLW